MATLNWINALAVFAGGGAGSLLRFGMGQFFKQLPMDFLPIATLASNLLSTALLGWLFFKFTGHHQASWFLMLSVGFCGGFSTFSTFSLETLLLIKNGQLHWAIANVTLSLAACLLLMFFLSKNIK